MRPLVPASLLTLIVVLVAPGCGPGDFREASGEFEPSRAGTLTVVTRPLPVVGFWEGRGQHPEGGLEFAMAEELVERLGLERLDVRTTPFPQIVTGETDGADVAMALLTPNSKREEALDFTSPYTHAAPTLLVREGTAVPDVQTAQGLRWGVGTGTTFETIVAERIRPDREALRFENWDEEIAALRGSRIDVAMFDLPAAAAIANAHPGLALAAKLSGTEPLAVAVPKGSANLEAVSAAIRAMVADGTVDALAERWLGDSLSSLDAEVPLLRARP